MLPCPPSTQRFQWECYFLSNSTQLKPLIHYKFKNETLMPLLKLCYLCQVLNISFKCLNHKTFRKEFNVLFLCTSHILLKQDIKEGDK